MKRHKSKKSLVYSSQTVPAIVPPLSSNNKFKVEDIPRMTGAQISDHIDKLSQEEKMDFMSHLSWEQLNELNDGIYINAVSNRSSRNPDLSHLSDKALEYYKQALYASYASYASQNNASGLIKRKHSTRHKKKRGKKTRKYRR
jgi:hypothetical protein